MTPEERARALVDAALYDDNSPDWLDRNGYPNVSLMEAGIAAAIREAVEEEREACAKIADARTERDKGTDLQGVSEAIADKIRARK